MTEHVFEGLDGGVRSEKPRSAGLTMVVDFGLGPNAQHDMSATAAGYVDFAKIGVGISRLLPDELLRAKIDAYRRHRIDPFPGGQFLEYAEISGKADRYLPAVARAGYRWVEVSDNVAVVSLEWKQAMIRQATDDFSLGVLGEVGQKSPDAAGKRVPMADDAKACLDAGARIVLLEAAELVADDPAIAREVEAVVDAVGFERLMFELPGPWISGVTLDQVMDMRNRLIGRFGPEVSLGNVQPGDLLSLEAYRRGLGTNAGAPIGG